MTDQLIDYEELIKPKGIAISNIEATLSIEQGFFKSLMTNGDDWAFIIKTHSLIDTSLAHLINESLNRPELIPLIDRLSIDGVRTSKLAFIEALNLLEKMNINFIKELSLLRNTASHSIQSVTITLVNQFAELPDNRVMNIVKVKPPKIEIPRFVEFVKRQPRLAIWLSAMDLLENIYIKKQQIISIRDPETRLKAFRLADIIRKYNPNGVGLLNPQLTLPNDPKENKKI